MAIQQQDKISFSTGRLFATPIGGGARLFYGDLTDVSVDIKVDLKEAFSEGQYAIAVADGHRSIDVSAKHYTLRLDALANDLNGSSTSTTSSDAFSWDEAGTVPATPFQYTLAQSATYIPNSLVLKVYVGVNKAPLTYKIVASGPIAGYSAALSAGVLTFASGDAGLAFSATYQYNNNNGSRITISNSFQGSTLPYTMVLAKRDISPIDGSIGQLIFTLNAVRFGGIKSDYKEGDFTVYDRSFKAYADTTGTVGYIEFVNTTGENAP